MFVRWEKNFFYLSVPPFIPFFLFRFSVTRKKFQRNHRTKISLTARGAYPTSSRTIRALASNFVSIRHASLPLLVAPRGQKWENFVPAGELRDQREAGNVRESRDERTSPSLIVQARIFDFAFSLPQMVNASRIIEARDRDGRFCSRYMAKQPTLWRKIADVHWNSFCINVKTSFMFHDSKRFFHLVLIVVVTQRSTVLPDFWIRQIYILFVIDRLRIFT